MTEGQKCPNCGATLPPNSPQGQCPACLIRIGFALGGRSLDFAARETESGQFAARITSTGSRRMRFIGDYELLEELARGGMGVVYKARQVSLNRLVALKMIRAGELANEVEVSRFRAEASAVGSLRHPNIVAIHEVGEHEGQHYFSMDYIEGKSLAELTREHVWPADRAATCVKTIAEAIYYAHQRGILHRDLKPSNVVLDALDEPHITDFGLAKRMEEESKLTASGAVVGTPSYMAPELTSGGQATAGPASDVYSLGAILYELLTGRAPFQGETTLETLRLVRETEPMPPRRLNPRVPGDLETICLKCLEKEPRLRYRAAQDLGDDLRRFLRREPIQARRSSALEQSLKWAKRKPAVAALIGMSGLAVSALIGSLVAQMSFQSEHLQRKRIEAALQYAEQARKAEGDQRKQKEAALVEAQRARQAEAEARAKETEQRRIADAALAIAEKHQYFRRITLAQHEWEANDVAEADRLLDECPAGLRHWEWHYLKRLCHSELRSINAFTNGAQSVAMTSDGKLIAALSADGVGNIWDDVTGLEESGFQDRLRGIASLAFNPGGDQLAIGTRNGTVELCNLRSASKVWSFKKHRSDVCCVAYSSDGRRLASAGTDGEILVWNADTGELLQEPLEHGDPINGIAISSDGKLIASASGRAASITQTGGSIPERPGVINIWDVDTGSLRFAIRDSVNVAYSLAFSPDGTHLASGHADATAKLWSVESGHWETTFRGHVGDVFAVGFSADGSRLVSGGRDGSFRVWMLNKGGEVTTYRGHKGQVHGVAFAGDGQRIVSASSDGTVKLWCVTHPEEAINLNGGDMTLAFSPKDNRLVSGSNVWNLATLKAEPPAPLGPSFSRVRFDPTGRLLAPIAGGSSEVFGSWNLESQQLIATDKLDNTQVVSVAFSPDGNTRASSVGSVGWGPSSHTVTLWDAASGRKIYSFRSTTNEINDLAFSPDGKLLALAIGDFGRNMHSGGEPGEVQLWDWKGLQLEKSLKTRRFGVWGLSFSPDGKRLASAGGLYIGKAGLPRLGEVEVWNVETGDEVFDLTGVNDNVFNVAFSPDGERLVAASGRLKTNVPAEIKIWDMDTGLVAFTLRGFQGPVHDVAFSPRGGRIATTGLGTVKIFGAE